MPNNFSEYYSAIKFLDSLNNYQRRPKAGFVSARAYSLYCTEKLLGYVGNPQKKLKYIHVTGTAGKGSVVELTHQLLKSAGYKVGSYVSPHSTTPIERIKINDRLIDPHDFARLFKKIEPALNKLTTDKKADLPSYYGIFLTFALLYFVEQKCDYVVIESHTGGLFDVTNIIPAPKICVITNIGLDHQNILGKTLTAIAHEKSGIIKKSCSFISAETRPQLKKIMKNYCEKFSAPYYFVHDHGSEEDNFLIVKKIAELMKIEDKHLNRAIKNFKLPCRVEKMSSKPLIILDGAHNLLKITRLKEKIKLLKYRRLHLIFTLSSNRNFRELLNILAPLAATITITRHLEPFHRANSLVAIKDYCYQKWPKKQVKIFIDPHLALRETLKKVNKNDCLLITGSFYLAGELRKHWYTEKNILINRSSF